MTTVAERERRRRARAQFARACAASQGLKRKHLAARAAPAANPGKNSVLHRNRRLRGTLRVG
jgi:hypothetical protein